MKIQVNNLGAIKEGTIDLSKKLNVFCGPNGTGKTYMAYLIYALTKLENKNIGVSLADFYTAELIEKNTAGISLEPDSIFEFREREFLQVSSNLWNVFAIPEAKAGDYFKDTKIKCLETREEFGQRFEALRIEETLKFYSFTFK